LPEQKVLGHKLRPTPVDGNLVDVVALYGLEQLIVIPIVDMHCHDDGAGRIEGLLHHRPDIVGSILKPVTKYRPSA
jgi:hypothetical protein